MAGSRLGVYGGTFDPLHNGHWRVAQAALAAFDFESLLFVPAFVPPHKRERKISAPYHRYAMLALATAAEERIFVSPIELEAPSRPYTIETLDHLRDEHRGAQLFFLMGSDSFAEVSSWREHERLLRDYSIIVAMRPGETEWESAVEKLAPESRERLVDLRDGAHPGAEMMSEPRIYLTAYVTVDISATEVREAAGAGQAIDHLVPEAVAGYIAKYGLYR